MWADILAAEKNVTSPEWKSRSVTTVTAQAHSLGHRRCDAITVLQKLHLSFPVPWVPRGDQLKSKANLLLQRKLQKRKRSLRRLAVVGLSLRRRLQRLAVASLQRLRLARIQGVQEAYAG